MRKEFGIVIAITVAFALAGCSMSGLQDKYVDAIRAYPGSSFESIPDEQLLAGFDKRCDVLDVFDSVGEVKENAHRQWEGVSSTSNVTESEYVANRAALFEAAETTCG